MKWTKQPLNKVADLCLGKMLDEKKNKGQPLPYLANINVRWGTFDLDNLREMRFEENELERYGLKYGDIVMCEGGEPGRCAIWKEAMPGMMIQKAIHRIRPHENLDFRYLYYDFLHKGRTGEFASMFTGATIKHLPGQNLAKIEIAIPPLDIQRRIADILSAYDDLIENNRRRIDLLERSAHMLYKEWFVFLRFPGHEHAKVKDGVPQGWEVKIFEETLANHIGGGWGQEEPLGNETTPAYVIRGTDITSIYDGEFQTISLRYHKEKPLEARLLIPGDIIFEVSGGSPTQLIGRSLLISERMLDVFDSKVICASFCKRFTPTSRLLSPYLYYHFKHIRESGELSKFIKHSASALQNFNFAAFLKLHNVLVPDIELLEQFAEQVNLIESQIIGLADQINALQQARDLLLPRLMNGEIPV